MRETIKMLVVLTLISTITGVSLAFFNQITAEPRIQAEFKFAKEPALKEVLPAYENDLVKDQFTIETADGQSITVYPAKVGGKVVAIAFESSGKGFGGPVRIMVGIDINTNVLRGIGVVAHSETPGLGARVAEDSFRTQFKGTFPVDSILAVKADSGTVDALSGATITSRAVCSAINSAFGLYKDHISEMAGSAAGNEQQPAAAETPAEGEAQK